MRHSDKDAPAPAAGALRDAVERRIEDRDFGESLATLLMDLCAVDTTPNADVGMMRSAEARCFERIERELADIGFAGARCERRPINPAIARHSAFTPLHFTMTPERPRGLSAAETYAGRSNLLYIVPGTESDAGGAAVNAHIDVVAPFFPPRREDDVVFGRGACDDKGSVVAIVGALRVLAEAMNEAGLAPRRNVVVMFVVEEETGGNGSLSLALDRELKRLYDSLVVMEGADNRLHPANRGAVWYRADLRPPAGAALEMAAFVIEEIEKEGRAIRAESRHALFPTRPAQTCHGIIGPFGEHPSRICGKVSFDVTFARPRRGAAEALLRDCLDAGLAEYVGLYGDKAKAVDPATGRPKVPRHYDVFWQGPCARVDVHGCTGHMGSIPENDGAITKMAALVRAIVRSRNGLATVAGSEFALTLSGGASPDALTLEGGQGFVPTHDIVEIMGRMRRAAEHGAENYLRWIGEDAAGPDCVRVSFDKLHNDAFDGDPDSPQMRRAIAAAKAAGTWRDEPIVGFPVSCDARLFANEYPGLPVLTTGPGKLAHAHADDEQLRLDGMRRAAAWLALYLLSELAP